MNNPYAASRHASAVRSFGATLLLVVALQLVTLGVLAVWEYRYQRIRAILRDQSGSASAGVDGSRRTP